ncbi:MAG: hypothetical protein D6732_15055 [Methanobacteriota archaeon]|nr:MAG: hypothetical protein D6732_15055 [Euryarchaeota archaeon]
MLSVQKIGGFIFVFLIVFTLVSKGQEIVTDPVEKIGEEELLFKLPESSSHLVLKGNETFWQFTFLVGPSIDADPIGTSYTPDQILMYGTFNNVTRELTLENVTSQLVYPSQYDFVVDDLGQVHTVFVSGLYTLYYAVRLTNGTWVEEQVTDPNNWWAWSPDIDLASDGTPRITYALSYKSGASEIFPMGFGFVGARSVHFAMKTDSGWTYYDVVGQIGNKILPGRLMEIQYPAFVIQNGSVYLAFTNRSPQGADTQIYFAHFPEDPSNSTTNQSLQAYVYKNVFSVNSVAGVFTYPEIFPYKSGVFLAGGSWVRNGAWYAYLKDLNVSQDEADWQSNLFSLDYISQEIKSMSGAIRDGKVYLAWSPYDLFDTTNNRFTQDIILTVTDLELSVENFTITFLTDTVNIAHEFPNLVLTEDSVVVISVVYNGTNPVPYFGYISAAAIIVEDPVPGGEIAFALTFAVMVIFVVVLGFAIRKVPVREEEEEILPHMVNLRDSITRD